jgi:hypothetical protein
MSNPKIGYCLVCEDVRIEQGNKLTILGFYGLLPATTLRVNIVLAKPGLSIKLMFLAGMSNGSGVAVAKILKPNNETLYEAPPQEVTGVPDIDGIHFGFGFLPVVFSEPGEYFFQLLFDGIEAAKYPFLVSFGLVPSYSPSASASPSPSASPSAS